MDTSEEQVPLYILLQQHGAVLEYERLVDAQEWRTLGERFPDGSPECACLICQQLDALSDRLVTMSHLLQRYDMQKRPIDSGLDATVSELIDIAETHRHRRQDTGD